MFKAKTNPDCGPLWHVHHNQLLGIWENGGIEDRRREIREVKPLEQQALRLKLLQPVKGKLPKAVLENLRRRYPWHSALKTEAQWRAVIDLHAKECAKGCPMQQWNGPQDEICPTG
jgi:hypothetical protein